MCFLKHVGSSKTYRTFIFSNKIEKAGGGRVGIVGCHVTSRQSKPVDLVRSGEHGSET
jgi:hypothetical protein